MILVPAVTLLLILIAGTVEHAEDFSDAMWIVEILILAVLAYLLLNGYLLYRNAQTIGKLMLKIRIVDHGTGEPAARWKLVCIRALFFPLPFLAPFLPLTLIPLVDLAPILGPARRCLHDYAAGTNVVNATREI
jgi:uncharacterized RDD family membrane protein YckC